MTPAPTPKDGLREVWTCDPRPESGQPCRQAHGCHCAEITALIASRDAAVAERDEARLENDHLRASLANSGGSCVYCALPREDWARCRDGFPGCARGDDAMLCPNVGASLEADDRACTAEARADRLADMERRALAAEAAWCELHNLYTETVDRALAAEGEVERLRDRLEISHAYDLNGDRVPFPEGMPDGIECRDETIRGLEEQIAKRRSLPVPETQETGDV